MDILQGHPSRNARNCLIMPKPPGPLNNARGYPVRTPLQECSQLFDHAQDPGLWNNVIPTRPNNVSNKHDECSGAHHGFLTWSLMMLQVSGTVSQ